MLNNQNADYTDDIDNAFPYAFGDWDNFDFNLPLWYALCDIQGVEPNTGKAKVRSGKMKWNVHKWMEFKDYHLCL